MWQLWEVHLWVLLGVLERFPLGGCGCGSGCGCGMRSLKLSIFVYTYLRVTCANSLAWEKYLSTYSGRFMFAVERFSPLSHILPVAGCRWHSEGLVGWLVVRPSEKVKQTKHTHTPNTANTQANRWAGDQSGKGEVSNWSLVGTWILLVITYYNSETVHWMVRKLIDSVYDTLKS